MQWFLVIEVVLAWASKLVGYSPDSDSYQLEKFERDGGVHNRLYKRLKGLREVPPISCVRTHTRAQISFCLELSLLHPYLSEIPGPVFSTLTTYFKSNLPPKPLTYLKISKSSHNLFRRPSGLAACNFLDSHHPSAQRTELFSARQLLVFSRLWICSTQ